MRPLNAGDYEEFRALRLAGLETHPEAFATDDEDWRNAPRDVVERLIQQSEHRVTLGAFGPQLCGVVGLRREQRPSVRHKASVWGLYVDPGHRRRGVAGALLDEALARARSMDGLEQIRLVVAAENAGAVALFEQLGFRMYGREERARLVDGIYYDQLYMNLYLSARWRSSPRGRGSLPSG